MPLFTALSTAGMRGAPSRSGAGSVPAPALPECPAAAPAQHTRAEQPHRQDDDQRDPDRLPAERQQRSEEHTSELQSLMRISYAVFCLKKKKKDNRLNCRPKHYTP